MLDINGIAHIALSVKDLNQSKPFYKELLPFLGLKLIHDGEESCYHVGSRTGILIQQINTQDNSNSFSQNNIGLHHLCFRARSKEDINKLANKLLSMEAYIVRGPIEGPWAPGYYYILFEDPDGIRLEVNFVPGQGLLDENNKFNANNDYL
tara:strand:- start:102 stop:554 length:453 start_codon:yes stop_codon:yes gene_type:complete